MKQSIVWVTVLGVILLVGIGMIYALRAPRATSKTYPADQGPNFIDVTNYPPKMQEAYELFTRKCSRCHTVARPINSTLPPSAWREYVYKMMRKPGSGLTPKTAEEIIQFLIYDADQGPNFIDVTNYPPKMQEAYELFTRKCSRCHTVARPINSTLPPSAWREYVYKMMRKPGSGLTPKTAEEIIQFLIYDSEHREKKTQ